LQATHNYVPLFIIAGVMHPLALFVIMFFAGRDFQKADLDTAESHAPSRSLTIAGSVVTLAGAVLLGVVMLEWAVIAKRSMSAAAQGLVASIGVMLLGVALLYASRGRRTSQASG
jgi:hypothetical protein